RPLNLGLVDLLHAVARVREPVRERPVVREQERAGRVGVESADGDDARLGRHELDDGGTALWVARGRDDARGLVQEDVREPEEGGGKLVGVWVTLGRYDVVEVFEAPDDETALEIVTKLGQAGGEDTETLRAFTREEAEEIIRKL